MITRKCRVCGGGYTLCKDVLKNPRKKAKWQEFACSESCGREYFKRIAASRNSNTTNDESEDMFTVEDEMYASPSIFEEEDDDLEDI